MKRASFYLELRHRLLVSGPLTFRHSSHPNLRQIHTHHHSFLVINSWMRTFLKMFYLRHYTIYSVWFPRQGSCTMCITINKASINITSILACLYYYVLEQQLIQQNVYYAWCNFSNSFFGPVKRVCPAASFKETGFQSEHKLSASLQGRRLCKCAHPLVTRDVVVLRIVLLVMSSVLSVPHKQNTFGIMAKMFNLGLIGPCRFSPNAI